MISVIIPAHNEEKNLSFLLPELIVNNQGLLQILVVCNACDDKSVEICKKYPEVVCIESHIPSKTNALNIGDRAAKYFPRFYLDADIIIDATTLIDCAKEMVKNNAPAGAPTMRVDYSKRPWIIKAYYRAWLRTPYAMKGMLGSGLYGVTEAGRNRFASFPDIISDDGYFRLLFRDYERFIDPLTSFTVKAPWNIDNLLRIKTRAHLGNIELEKKFPELCSNENAKPVHHFMFEIFRINRLPDSIIYLVIKGIAKRRALRRYRLHQLREWERDLSNR